MKTTIVITSIFPPTEAVKKFGEGKSEELIVVGDKKSPLEWNCPRARFLNVEEQEKSGFHLTKTLPYNHYSRKMTGYLTAIRNGATSIIDADDDNIPFDDWGFPLMDGTFDTIDENKGFINIYNLFTDQKIWPRGFPLRKINDEKEGKAHIEKKHSSIGVWQGLADEDPDVDAIYRLTDGRECFFQQRQPVVLGKGTLSPFNTQNTLIRKELFPLMYLPAFVTFRYTDILRGLIAQPIMWLYGFNLGFTSSTVVQKRNPHDYFKDFLSEIPMYETAEKVVETVSCVISEKHTPSENLLLAYQKLLDINVVTENEIVLLKDWIEDLKQLGIE